MPFQFSFLCDLLSDLEAVALHEPPLKAAVLKERCYPIVVSWFRQHRELIDATDAVGVALLSSLLPRKRVDRVYNLQPPSLTKLLGRCFGLGTSRMPLLQRWKEPGGGDLGICVERVLKETPFPEHHRNLPTLEQIDFVLNEIAKRSPFSGPDIRVRKSENGPYHVDQKLRNIYCRLKPHEAKWLTRTLLKDYGPVLLPEGLILSCFHQLLPNIMKIHDNLKAAVAYLREANLMNTSKSLLFAEDINSRRPQEVAQILPKCGAKIGRPYFLKAWSVKEAVKLAHGRRMSLERKYDGEYCQIHIDLRKRGNEIQIFSKSGKDSTKDRRGVHATIKECLRIGYDDCQFTHQCILEGELLVFSDETKKILDFHKLRKHVDRSGVHLGTKEDSQCHPWEHLMIMFFDVMMIDEEPVLHQKYKYRQERLMDLVTVIPGRADFTQYQQIDFSRSEAPHALIEALANGFARRWEGHVLKPVDEPYVNLQYQSSGEYRSCWIKLKKDYIPGLGDTAELAVVGARYDVTEAARLKTSLPWNVFYLGALVNKDEVFKSEALPRFKVLDSFNIMITLKDMERLCQIGQFSAEKIGQPQVHAMLDKMQQEPHFHAMDVVFKDPFVFEIKGGGFDKPSNADYFTLRFPRLVKIHWDRKFKDTVSFDKLQKMAHQAMNAPEGDLHTDIASWKARIDASERGKKGKRCWWEESQEPDAESDHDNVAPVFIAESPRQMRRPRDATFVRMDTAEMLPTERRRDNGEVVSRPFSSHSASTTESACSLPSTPPSSPPTIAPPPAGNVVTLEEHALAKRKGRIQDEGSDQGSPASRSRQRLEAATLPVSSPPHPRRHVALEPPPQMKGSKRMRDDDSDISLSVPKARRTAQEPPTIPHPSNTTPERTALVEVINSALPISTSKASTTITSRDGLSPSSFALVRKLPPLIPIPTTPRRATAISSPASPANTTPTASPTASTSSPTPPPPSTPPPSLPTPSPPPIPNPINSLRHRLTLLSPCIAQMPYLTADLLPSLAAYPVTGTPLLPAALRCAHDVPGRADFVALVESPRRMATARFLRDLEPLVALGVGEVEVWDWRVAEEAEGRDRWFVGWMRGDGRGKAWVIWRGGERSGFGNGDG